MEERAPEGSLLGDDGPTGAPPRAAGGRRRRRGRRGQRTHAFATSVLRAIGGNVARFLAVLGIVAIGAGVYAGLRMFEPDMFASADAYFDRYNLADVQVSSPEGLDEGDLEAIRAVAGVRGVAGMQTFEMSVARADGQGASDTFELQVEAVSMGDYADALDAADGLDGPQDAVSRVQLVRGRLPQAPDEIAVTTSGDGMGGGNIEVGDVLTVSSVSDAGAVSDVLAQTSFKVVGLVQSPEWISRSASISPTSGSPVTNCAYVDLAATAHPDLYTTAQVTVADAYTRTAFTDAYDRAVGPTVDAIKAIAPQREQARYDELLAQARRAVEALGAGPDAAGGTSSQLGGAGAGSLASQAQALLDELVDQGPQRWYVVGRDANPGYYIFEATALRMGRICSIFPAFFFLVAALVCLTTVRRMVEVDRTEIGTLKALGYSSWRIATKYLAFTALAATLGAVAGVVAGALLLPGAIWVPYSRMYVDFPFVLGFHQPDCAVALAVSVGLALGATALAVRRTLRLPAAELLQPAAPKGGRRILLERVRPLWRRMGFAQKVTARNAFRYKGRMVMIVVGLAGCTGLMLTGFGVQDKLDGFVQEQYGGIYTYDVTVNFDGSAFSAAGTSDAGDAGESAGIAGGATGEAGGAGDAGDGADGTATATGEAGSTAGLARSMGALARRLGAAGEAGAGTDDALLESSRLTAALDQALGRQADAQGPGDWCYFMRQAAIASNPDGEASRIPYGIGGALDRNGGSVEATLREGRSDRGGDEQRGIVRDIGVYVPKEPTQDLIAIAGLDGDPIELPERGAVITQRLAEQLMVGVGDTIQVSLGADGEAHGVRVAAIMRNFVGHYVYMSPSAFQDAFGTAPTYNCALGRNAAGLDEGELVSALAQADPAVTGVGLPGDESRRYEDVAASLNGIVGIIVAVSGMLVAIVVYALTEINIEERSRELATLRVLGFTRREVRGYVYRETYLLGALGIACGLPFGTWLCSLAMRSAEFDNVIYYRTIDPSSYLIAAALTAAFSLLVMLAMRARIDAIDMAGSLRSRE
jgi:ABC-type lipoprotein release transport system permease subunit